MLNPFERVVVGVHQCIAVPWKVQGVDRLFRELRVFDEHCWASLLSLQLFGLLQMWQINRYCFLVRGLLNFFNIILELPSLIWSNEVDGFTQPVSKSWLTIELDTITQARIFLRNWAQFLFWRWQPWDRMFVEIVLWLLEGLINIIILNDELLRAIVLVLSLVFFLLYLELHRG